MSLITKSARDINNYSISNLHLRVKKNLKLNKLKPNKVKIFLSGFAFKGNPATSDIRGSTAIDFLKKLQDGSIKKIYGHDFLLTNQDISKLNVNPVTFENGIKNADVIIIFNNHKSYLEFNVKKLLLKSNKPCLFFDSWQIFKESNLQRLPGITYNGIGY